MEHIIWESIPDGVLIVQEEGTIHYCNNQLNKVFGYGKDELLNQNLDKLIPERLRKRHPCLIRNYFKRPQVRKMNERGNLTGLTKDGKEVYVDVTLGPLSHDDKQMVVALIRDVTVQKEKMRKLESACNNLNSFASTVAHDLRQPLTALNLSVSVLEDSLHDNQNDAWELLAMMKKKIDLMNQMLNQILEYSKMGHEKIVPEPVNIHSLVEELISSLNPPAGFRIHLSPELPEIMVKKVFIQQVFMNLINNAIKYNDKPLGEIKIGSYEKGNYYEFYVEDNGPGIPEYLYSKIFSSFKSSGNSKGGFGLGLAISRKIVRQIGNGEIKVISKEGEGTKLIFSWRKY